MSEISYDYGVDPKDVKCPVCEESASICQSDYPAHGDYVEIECDECGALFRAQASYAHPVFEIWIDKVVLDEKDADEKGISNDQGI